MFFIAAVLLLLLSGDTFAEDFGPRKASIQNLSYYGKYSTKNGGDFIEWNVVIIPQHSYSKEDLIDLAKELYLKYKTRVKIFDNTEQLKQFIARDKFFNDRSETEVPYPAEWAKKHYLACVTFDLFLKKWAINTYVGESLIGIDLASWPDQKKYITGDPL